MRHRAFFGHPKSYRSRDPAGTQGMRSEIGRSQPDRRGACLDDSIDVGISQTVTHDTMPVDRPKDGTLRRRHLKPGK
jgi:hypothetical protein